MNIVQSTSVGVVLLIQRWPEDELNSNAHYALAVSYQESGKLEAAGEKDLAKRLRSERDNIFGSSATTPVDEQLIP